MLLNSLEILKITKVLFLIYYVFALNLFCLDKVPFLFYKHIKHAFVSELLHSLFLVYFCHM